MGIAIGGILVLALLGSLWKKFTGQSNQPIPIGQYNHSITYRCRFCGWTDLLYRVVAHDNPNNNAGRPYCVCVNPRCSNVINSPPQYPYRGWVSWCDDRGILPGNPPCRCGRVSRRDHTRERPGLPSQIFFTCSTGACHFEHWPS